MNQNNSRFVAKFIAILQIVMQVFLVPFASTNASATVFNNHDNGTNSIKSAQNSNGDSEPADDTSALIANSVIPLAESMTTNGNNASSYAISAATGLVTDSVQQWLSQFGTARVQLGVNEDYNLSDSAIDTLIPLYSQKNIMLFTQLGYRHKDDRNTGNFGLGGRFYFEKSMFGLNAFYDNDFTGNNKRAGVGAEYWRDYVKFGANGYFGLTNWHQSHDLADYDERPANGFDVRAEGYIPHAPQFGAKVIYEQYYGKDVALFGKSSRENNPKAITVGVNYTPIPLLTMGIDFKDSQKSTNSDTVFGLEFNYDFGVPLSEQLDPQKVTLKRSLAGSRMDLVERNNDIVLEYRKQDILSAHITELLKGIEKTSLSARLTIKSKYGVSNVKWSGSVLSQPGVSIREVRKGDFGAWNLVLPAYRPNAQNQYTLTASVQDNQGNIAAPTTSDVIVEQNQGDLVKGSLNCSPETVIITPTSKAVCSVKVDNGQGDVFPNAKVSWKTDKGTLSAQNSVSDDKGVATVNLQNNQVSIASISASLNADTLTTKVHFTAGSVSSEQSTLSVTPDIIKADGKSTSKILFIAKDGSANRIDNLKVAFASSGTPIKLSQVKAEGNGTYSATLTGVVAGVSTITVSADGTLVDGLQASVKLTSGDVDANHSQIKAVPARIQADGKTTSVVILTARDKNDNPITGANFTFRKVSGVDGSLSAVSETGAPGEYRATFTAGIQAGSFEVGVMQASNDTHIQTSITLVAQDISPTHSTLTAVPSSIVADGISTSLITFKAMSDTDVPLSGLSVVFRDDGTVPVSIGRVTESAIGVYTATLTGVVAGTTIIAVSANGTNVGGLQTSVKLTSGDVDANHSQIKAVPARIQADGKTTSVVILTARDKNDNPITGANFTFRKVSGVDGSLSAVSETGAPGEYRATFTAGIQAGSFEVGVMQASNDTHIQTSITLVAQDISPTHSTLTAVPSSIVADGISTSLITFKAMSDTDVPLSGLSVVFRDDGTVPVSIGRVTESAIGVYTATLTSGIKSGSINIHAEVAGTAVGQPVNVMLTPGAISPTQSALDVSKPQISADGVDSSVITFMAKDSKGNGIDGLSVSFIPTGTTINQTDVKAIGGGQYIATITGKQPGSVTFHASINGSESGVNPVSITLVTGALDPVKSTIEAAPATISANGVEASTLTFKAKDTVGHALTGLSVEFNYSGVPVKATAVTETGEGMYTATLTGTIVGDVSIAASVDGNNATQVPAKVKLAAGALDSVASTIEATPTTILANGIQTSTLTFKAKDAAGHGLTGLSVEFSYSGVPVKATAVTEIGDGVYTATLTGTTIGDVSIAASVAGNNATQVPAKVTLTAGALDPMTSTIDATPTTISANGVQTSTLIFKAKDTGGHALTGLSVVFNYSGVPVQASAIAETGDGTYTATLTGTVVGDVTVAASVAGNNATQTPAKVTLTKGYAFTGIQATKDNAVADGTAQDEVKATVVDEQTGNPAKGQVVTFNASNSAVISSESVITDVDGIATITVTSIKDGKSTITATLSDSTPVVVDTINQDVTFIAPAPLTFDHVKVNHWNFPLPSPFPDTGFKGATFQLFIDPSLSMNANEFNWSSSEPSLAAVDEDGNVTFVDDFPPGNNITITAEMKSQPNRKATHTFSVKKWFIGGMGTRINFEAARVWCRDQGYTAANLSLLGNSGTNGQSHRDFTKGTLWPQWGSMQAYGWSAPDHWAGPDVDNTAQVDEIGLWTGGALRSGTTDRHVAACVKDL